MSKSPLYTTSQVAATLGRGVRQVLYAATRLKIGQRVGRFWLYRDGDIARIKAALHDRPGRPRKDVARQ